MGTWDNTRSLINVPVAHRSIQNNRYGRWRCQGWRPKKSRRTKQGLQTAALVLRQGQPGSQRLLKVPLRLDAYFRCRPILCESSRAISFLLCGAYFEYALINETGTKWNFHLELSKQCQPQFFTKKAQISCCRIFIKFRILPSIKSIPSQQLDCWRMDGLKAMCSCAGVCHLKQKTCWEARWLGSIL